VTGAAGRDQAVGEGLDADVAQLPGSRTASTTWRIASITSSGWSIWM
jgi:hypothetical protein